MVCTARQLEGKYCGDGWGGHWHNGYGMEYQRGPREADEVP